MGGIAIVRPALNVFGFNSGNVSLSAIRSFSPFSCTCLAERNADVCSDLVVHLGALLPLN